MNINISQIAQALENQHGDMVTELLLALIRNTNDGSATPITYEKLDRAISGVCWNLGICLENIIKEAEKEDIRRNYDFEDYNMPAPTFQEYMQQNIALQKRVARSFNWNENDDHPDWFKVRDHIYITYYKPNFGVDIEFERES